MIVALLTVSLVVGSRADDKDCGNVPIITNGGRSDAGGTTYGDLATFACNTGYTISGDADVTCQASGTWETLPATCTIKDCGNVPIITNGGRSDAGGTTYGDTATFACNTGYTISGDADVTCQASGTWETLPATCPIKACGGIQTGSSGNITSPGYEYGRYGSSQECTWFITNPSRESSSIMLRFSHFDLEYDPTCEKDYIDVIEDSSGNSLGRYCGNATQLSIFTVSRSISVIFKSDGAVEERGFSSFYRYDHCGGILSETNGVVHSPNYPDRYENNDGCAWLIVAPEGEQIVINFKAMRIEGTTNCEKDSLVVYNGPNDSSPLIGRFCGSESPEMILSRSNTLYIVFSTDDTWSDEGFEFSYAHTADACGGYPNSSPGYISSPGFLRYSGRYSNNQECVWYLSSLNPNSSIWIYFDWYDFQLEASDSCLNDFLELYEGSSSFGNSLGRYCGTTRPSPIVSIPQNMYLRFKTDSSGVDNGFHLTYKFTQCGGMLTENSGAVRSPNYPENYNNDDGCVWEIVAPESMNISITFSVMQIEDYTNCGYDSLEFLDDSYSSFRQFCGTTVPPAFLYQGDFLRVVFLADYSVIYSGFEFNYTFV